MSSLIMKNVLKNGTSVTIGASETDTVVSKTFDITDRDSVCFTVDLIAASGTYTTGITAKIQSTPDGGTNWIDSGTVAISADGIVSLALDITQESDTSKLPLRGVGRIVVSSGASDAVTITAVYISRRKSF